MTTPKLVHEVLEERAKNDADRPAMRVKRNGGWRTTTWGSYARDAKRAGRAFIKLGVERGKGVALIGYNCPEWVIADVGAILAGAMPAGIYTTNSAEPGMYSQRSTFVVRNDFTLKLGSPTSSIAYAKGV